MKDSLQPGLQACTTLQVDRERTIDFMGESARVYATPMLVRDIEVACRELLLEHLDAGEDSVGTRVEIDHIGATLMGMPVELTVRIAEVEPAARSPSRSRRATASSRSCAAAMRASSSTWPRPSSAWPPRPRRARRPALA
jgi:predicted thioesterase